MSSSEERAARNEALFREVNEQIGELATRIRRAETIALVCECSDRDCLAGIEVEPDAYRQVRLHPFRFLLLPGHELPEIERVVERRPGYLVVEKFAAVARAALDETA